MLLDGVPVDEQVVRQLARVVDRPLGTKLDQAVFFSAEIVALTRNERRQLLDAIERGPMQHQEIREQLLLRDAVGST